MHYHSAVLLCAPLLCPKCSQFAVKHDECGMSSLTTHSLGYSLCIKRGVPCQAKEKRGDRGDAGWRALKSRWHWQKGWHCVRPHDQMIVSQSHILQPALCDQKLSHEQLARGIANSRTRAAAERKEKWGEGGERFSLKLEWALSRVNQKFVCS